MTAYVARRLLLIIPTLFIASLIIFALIRFIPGDIVDQMASQHIFFSEMDRAQLEHELGLDLPIHVQYGHWIEGIFRGDFGVSLWAKTPVSRELGQRLPVTIELGLLAITVGLVIALPIGMYSAIRQDTLGDYVGRSFAILCISIPGFWLGTLIIVFPSIWWGWSPPTQYVSFPESPMTNLKMFIFPAIVLGLALSGVTMRMTRTMMLEVLRQDYIRTAWAKGLKERVVITRHALKNALIPVVTIVGLQLPILVGGSVIIEQIFSLPGIGRLMLDALVQRDYPIVTGVMFTIAIFVLLVNLVVDLSYGFLDPRVKYR
mgnify:CR=1 FL=1